MDNGCAGVQRSRDLLWHEDPGLALHEAIPVARPVEHPHLQVWHLTPTHNTFFPTIIEIYCYKRCRYCIPNVLLVDELLLDGHSVLLRGKIKRIAFQFTPYSWVKFEWKPASNLRRWLAVLGIIFMVSWTCFPRSDEGVGGTGA